jgi:hypothetical protein
MRSLVFVDYFLLSNIMLSKYKSIRWGGTLHARVVETGNKISAGISERKIPL